MPSRDEEAEARREQILTGAYEVFTTKGFESASTRDIANAAKIKSTGLIYHYFENKEHLFQQVIEKHAPILGVIREPEALMALPLRDGLLVIANAFLAVAENNKLTPMIRLILGESVRRPAIAALFNTIGPRRLFTLLSTYLERHMEAGTLRQVDIGVAVRAFIGPFVAFILTHEVMLQSDSASLSAETMAEQAVDIFLHGMMPATEPPHRE